MADKNKGISSLDELQGLEVLRTEFVSSNFMPRVVISYDNISFNVACAKLLPDTQFVNVLIDRVKKRIIILPAHMHAKDALRWYNIKKEQIVKRTCTAKKFGEKLYTMMRWVKENKYRVLAYFQEIEGVRLIVFNLEEYEMLVPELVTTKSGKVIRRGKAYLPGAWEADFGMPLAEHKTANDVELNAHYTLSDKDMEVTIAEVKIQGKTPTEEEIIMSQYRKGKLQGGAR